MKLVGTVVPINDIFCLLSTWVCNEQRKSGNVVPVENNETDNNSMFMLIFWGILSSRNDRHSWKWNAI